MKRMLILTNDKNNAVRLRTMLEKIRVEFEIAIGEDTGRAILSERFMNVILLDASALRGGTSWVFSFLENRRLHVPIVLLGGDEKALREAPPHPELVRYVPAPFDTEKLEAAINAATSRRDFVEDRLAVLRDLPLASASALDD